MTSHCTPNLHTNTTQRVLLHNSSHPYPAPLPVAHPITGRTRPTRQHKGARVQLTARVRPWHTHLSLPTLPHHSSINTLACVADTGGHRSNQSHHPALHAGAINHSIKPLQAPSTVWGRTRLHTTRKNGRHVQLVDTPDPALTHQAKQPQKACSTRCPAPFASRWPQPCLT